MNIMWLKLIGPIIIVGLIWWWNRRIRLGIGKQALKPKKKTLHFEFGTQDLETLKTEFPPLNDFQGLKTGQYRFYKVMEDEKIIGILLYNWPSSLWTFREGRNEEISLGSYSHIHYVEVLEEYRKRGYLTNLLDLVFSETHRISSGITIDVVDPELKEILRKKFEFKDCGSYMRLNYDNWI